MPYLVIGGAIAVAAGLYAFKAFKKWNFWNEWEKKLPQ